MPSAHFSNGLISSSLIITSDSEGNEIDGVAVSFGLALGSYDPEVTLLSSEEIRDSLAVMVIIISSRAEKPASVRTILLCLRRCLILPLRIEDEQVLIDLS